MRKIALTGAHGTGKTTLATEIVRRLRGNGLRAELTEEIPRLLCEHAKDEGFFRRGNNSVLKQALVMQYQVQLELSKLQASPEFLICDRGLLDHWAYTKCLFGSAFSEQGVIEVYERIVADYCRSYAMLFYVPIEFPPKDDGIRESDVAFQHEIDRLIREFLVTHALRSETITGALNTRCERALSILRE